MLILNLQIHTGPLHRRLYEELKSSIHSGRINAGARLPSSRNLAVDLGISRNTVLQAYEQLQAEGYVTSLSRAITCVAAQVPNADKFKSSTQKAVVAADLSKSSKRLLQSLQATTTPPIGKGLRYDFRYGRPAIRDFPREVWNRLLAARARAMTPEAFAYASPDGYEPLREALSDYLRRARGLSCDASQILIVNGSQQGFDLAARVLLNPGDGVLVEEPSYPGATLAYEVAGAKLCRLPVDHDGVMTNGLGSLQKDIRIASVAPCHQFPTGVVLSMERRLELLAWASRTKAWIVEDDYISEYRYEGRPLEAMQALDQDERVIYIGTFSKTIFPSLRLAYLVLPSALVKPFTAMKFATDRFSSVLAQQALTDFIVSGQFERHLRRSSTRNAALRRVLVATLKQSFGDRIEVSGRDAGVHVMVWLNDIAPRKVDGLIARAAKMGVGIYSIAPYFEKLPTRAGLLFGYTALTETEIRQGIRKLAAVL
jgi:GntR family transcriptional regulator / MocR family aminotransferase